MTREHTPKPPLTDPETGKIDWDSVEQEYGGDQVRAIKIFRKYGVAGFRHGISAEGFPVTEAELEATRPKYWRSSKPGFPC